MVIIPEEGLCREEDWAKRWERSSRVSAMLALTMSSAQAYNPTGGILYQLGDEPCLKGRGNCAVYPKSAQLPSGRLVAAFEKATVVPETGSADRETLPVYKSDDHGTSWQPLSDVKAPAYLSNGPQVREVHEQLDEPVPLRASAGRRRTEEGHAAPGDRRVGRRPLLPRAQGSRPELDAVQRRRPQRHGDRPVLQHRRRRDAGRSSTSSRPAAGRAAARARSARTSPTRTRTSRSIPSGSRT